MEAARTVVELAAALDPVVDERGSPKKQETAAGMPILQPTDERRRTGSHYTPRTLTGPIVKHALGPAFERLGPVATPEQILDLKVCDPAMGSGAFLVEACRALAAKLAEAWARYPDRKPIIPADEDEELHARRLVAQRCLYGVDKNPLATDLAKLSLWLATLARDHEFTFLDHALKSGDGLVGLTQAQISAAHWDTSKPGLPLFRQLVKDRVAEAMKDRAEIQAAPDDTGRAIQEQRHRSLEARLQDVRLVGDAVIASFFSADKPKAREKKRAEVESWLTGSLDKAWDKLVAIGATLKQSEHPLTPFHWEVEFPEVFARGNGGFDAIIGNPPFAGKNMIANTNRRNFLTWLRAIHDPSHGNADLVSHFFRRAFAMLRQGGTFGLIATNTIGQGDTRTTGLAPIIAAGGSISRAIKRLRWPGAAAVVVSVVHVFRGQIRSPVLDGREVERISAYLMEGELDDPPALLGVHSRKSFQGTNPVGAGFLFDDERALKGETSDIATMNKIVEADGSLRSFVKPYTSGEDVANHPEHMHTRYVIDFGDLTEDQARSEGGALFQIVERMVRPVRQKDKRAHRRVNWWKHGEPQKGLYAAVRELAFVLVAPQTSPHLQIGRRINSGLFASTVIVFTFDDMQRFSLLQSRCHEVWARFFSSSMKDDLRYAPSDCFETFPFSREFENSPTLEAAGRAYHVHRAALMIARNEGMTETYNRLHDSTETAEDIRRLRELHAAMDRAVFEAYGWHDLAARAAPVFLDETTEDDHTYQGRLFWPSDFRDEVLARLLALNAERNAEEIRLGIAPGMKGKARDEEDDEVTADDD